MAAIAAWYFLRGRGTDAEEVIQRRLRDAAGDMGHWREFEFVVVNDDFERALGELGGQRPDVVYVIESPLSFTLRDRIVASVGEQRLRAVYGQHHETFAF